MDTMPQPSRWYKGRDGKWHKANFYGKRFASDTNYSMMVPRYRAYLAKNKRRRYQRPRSVVPRGPKLALFRNAMRVKLNYCVIGAPVALGAGGLWTGTITANDVYNPNETGFGTSPHQPLGFDQLTTIYTRFFVVGTKCRYSLIDRTGTNYSYTVGMVPSVISTASLGDIAHIQAAMEQKGAVYTHKSNTGGPNDAYLTQYRTTSNMFGLRIDPDEDVYQCTSTSAVSRKWYWNFWSVDDRGSLAAGGVVAPVIKMTYYVVAFQPTLLGTS